MINRFIFVLATGCGIGYMPGAPGTFASVAALGMGYALTAFNGLSPAWLALAAALLFVPAVQAAKIAQKRYLQTDPQVVVIDEVVGQWVALSAATGDNPRYWVLGFVLFRIFDVLKPYPIKKLECLSGGWGIVVDDVAAGLYAMMILVLVRWSFG